MCSEGRSPRVAIALLAVASALAVGARPGAGTVSPPASAGPRLECSVPAFDGGWRGRDRAASWLPGIYPNDPMPPGRFAITLDDGPMGSQTRDILDLLAELQMPAAFFVVGRKIDEDSYRLVQRMVAEGHTLGNHTYDHDTRMYRDSGDNPAAYVHAQYALTQAMVDIALLATSDEDFGALRGELLGTWSPRVPRTSLVVAWDEIAPRHVGILMRRAPDGTSPYRMIYSRPPGGSPYYGDWSTRSRETFADALRATGMLNVLWTHDTRDSSSDMPRAVRRDPGRVAREVIEAAREGGVLLAHDRVTYEGLAQGLERVREEGLQAVTLDEITLLTLGCTPAELAFAIRPSADDERAVALTPNLAVTPFAGAVAARPDDAAPSRRSRALTFTDKTELVTRERAPEPPSSTEPEPADDGTTPTASSKRRAELQPGSEGDGTPLEASGAEGGGDGGPTELRGTAPNPSPCADAPEGFACVPGGWLVRGIDEDPHACDQSGQPHSRRSSSVPASHVWVDSFFMAITETTNAEFARCQAEGACDEDAGPGYRDFDAPDQPITGISWFDARDYCDWLGGRLPTEAEWEMAARGPDGELNPWGDEPASCELAVIRDGTGRSCGVERRGSTPETGRVLEPCSRGPHRFGLCDMVGNAEEWVADAWSEDWASCGEACSGIAPRGPCGGDEPCEGHDYRVVRGGSWYWPAEHATGAHRRRHHADNEPYHHFGFRCMLPLAPGG